MRFDNLIICCILTALSLEVVFSAKIVFLFAGGNISHKIGIWPFVLGLAERGHQITFVSSSAKALKSHPNIKDVTPEASVKATIAAFNVDRFKARENGEDTDVIHRYEHGSLASCKTMLYSNDTVLHDIIENVDKYDLAIVNSIYGECGTLIASSYGSKVIIYSSSTIIPWFHSTYGIPWQASYISDMAVKLTYPLGYIDRIINSLSYYQWSTRPRTFTDALENLMKERFSVESVPSFIELERNASLVFYNAHHAIDYSRPLPPMFIPVGGMQCWDTVGTLPKDIQEFMDNAKDGVILIAFGSTVELSNLSKHYLDMFFNMMKKFSTVRFIWRWKGKMPENHPENLMAGEWLPQKAVLNHPNIRAFMTHCGINSVTEATCFGVPLIGSPLFADQDYTAYRIEAQEIGVKLEIKGITQNAMDSAVQKILSNPKFKSNMVARSRMLKDQPQNPIDAAIYWTEFVLRHDDMSSFKPMALEQPWFVRTMLDVYIGIFFLVTILPLILIYVMVVLVKRLTR